MGLNHSRAKSFSFAFVGLKEAFQKEPNLRTHTAMAILVLVAAALLRFNPVEWILLIIVIFFVLVFELLNTALESVINLVSPEIKSEAKIAKDVSAAAVLFASLLSVIVGIFLFGPKLVAFFK